MFARRKFLASGLGAAAGLGLSRSGRGLARAQDVAGLKNMGSPWPLRDSEAFEYHSKVVGDRMAIGVWSPPAEILARSKRQDSPLDIVYVLDGASRLGLAASICMLNSGDKLDSSFAPVLLVGLDYPIGQRNARARDYNPADIAPASLMKMLSASPQTTPGGADKFLAFLETELDPLIRSRYKVTSRPAGILGHSAGGTFAFYAFLKQSRIFDRYWLGSPGIFTTGTDYVGQFEARLKDKLVHPTRMFLSMGSREMDGGDALLEDMGRNYARLVSVLNKLPNDRLTWTSKIYDGYTHRNIVPPALNDALLYLFRK